MSDHEIVEMRATIETLQRRVAELETDGTDHVRGGPLSRRMLLGLAGTGVAGIALHTTSSPAAALAGDPINVDEEVVNTGTNPTIATYSSATAPPETDGHASTFIFRNTDPAQTATTLDARTAGTGHTLRAESTNSDSSDHVVIAISESSGSTVHALSFGSGTPLHGGVQNLGSAAPAVRGLSNGTGPGGRFDVTLVTNSVPCVDAETSGVGPAIRGVIDNSDSTADAVHGDTGGSGAGVRGSSSSGHGVVAVGGLAPLHLVPAPLLMAAAAPTSGDHLAGELYVDPSNDLWYCTASGTPGTWTKLNDQPNPTGGPDFLASPAHAFDSRPGRLPDSGEPAVKGPFAAGETRVVDLSVAGGLTPGASAALVNVTLAGTGGGAGGFVSVYSNAVTLPGSPTFSNVNWTLDGQQVANTTAVAVDADGKVKVYASGPTDVILDVIATYA